MFETVLESINIIIILELYFWDVIYILITPEALYNLNKPFRGTREAFWFFKVYALIGIMAL